MTVSVVFPTCNPPRAEACADRWLARGYCVGLLVNTGWGSEARMRWRSAAPNPWHDAPETTEYRGYYASQNYLATAAILIGCKAVICAGDDMDPDPTHDPATIVAEAEERSRASPFPGVWVLQPCGDDAGKDADGVPAAARICGSPWLSPAYVRRGYGGRGPYPAAPAAPYKHLFGDEELKETAEKNGILQMRPDLIQEHLHWSFGKSPKEKYASTISSYWDHDQAIFRARKAAGFPGASLGAP